jgi:hypothetical protein
MSSQLAHTLPAVSPRSRWGLSVFLLRGRALALLALLALAACGQVAEGHGLDTGAVRPSEFSLHYSYSTPSLGPQYARDYTITVGLGATGSVAYRHGSGAAREEWVEPFAVSEADLDALYALAMQQGLFTRSWPQGETLIGGPQKSLQAVAAGQQVSVPSALDPAHATDIGTLYDAIAQLVPQSVWDTFEAKRAEYDRTH